MASRLDLNFEFTLNGTIWNMLSEPENDILILEVRNEIKHEVRFAALDHKQKKFLWKDIIFDETWWIGLTAVTPEVLLLHCYENSDNPDDKSLLAWHIIQQKVVWQLNHFVFSSLEGSNIQGKFTNVEAVDDVCVDSLTGKILGSVKPSKSFTENIFIQKPFQYMEGTEHFETVKTFLVNKFNILPIGSLEYLEFEELIFISYNVKQEGLVNYLLVLTVAGNEVLLEKLDDSGKGLGLETFFVLSGCLFFVRNKSVLISYKIV